MENFRLNDFSKIRSYYLNGVANLTEEEKEFLKIIESCSLDTCQLTHRLQNIGFSQNFSSEEISTLGQYLHYLVRNKNIKQFNLVWDCVVSRLQLTVFQKSVNCEKGYQLLSSKERKYYTSADNYVKPKVLLLEVPSNNKKTGYFSIYNKNINELRTLVSQTTLKGTSSVREMLSPTNCEKLKQALNRYYEQAVRNGKECGFTGKNISEECCGLFKSIPIWGQYYEKYNYVMENARLFCTYLFQEDEFVFGTMTETQKRRIETKIVSDKMDKEVFRLLEMVSLYGTPSELKDTEGRKLALSRLFR